MSDYEEATIKCCEKSKLSKLFDGDSLIEHKIRQDGLSIQYDVVFNSRKDAARSEFVIENSGKYDSAVAVRFLNTPINFTSIKEKIAPLESELSTLNKFIGIDGISAIRKRVISEKSKTKACKKCGHRHNTDKEDNRELPFMGCVKCGYNFYLFSNTDIKKLQNAKIKFAKVKKKIDDLQAKMDLKVKNKFTKTNWSWYVGAGTKAVAENLRGYD
jgi:hypothetical protein